MTNLPAEDETRRRTLDRALEQLGQVGTIMGWISDNYYDTPTETHITVRLLVPNARPAPDVAEKL